MIALLRTLFNALKKDVGPWRALALVVLLLAAGYFLREGVEVYKADRAADRAKEGGFEQREVADVQALTRNLKTPVGIPEVREQLKYLTTVRSSLTTERGISSISGVIVERSTQLNELTKAAESAAAGKQEEKIAAEAAAKGDPVAEREALSRARQRADEAQRATAEAAKAAERAREQQLRIERSSYDVVIFYIDTHEYRATRAAEIFQHDGFRVFSFDIGTEGSTEGAKLFSNCGLPYDNAVVTTRDALTMAKEIRVEVSEDLTLAHYRMGTPPRVLLYTLEDLAKESCASRATTFETLVRERMSTPQRSRDGRLIPFRRERQIWVYLVMQ